MEALPVFADVDTGVDDAIALIYLLASPDAELIGIASTGGNVAVQQVCRNNLALLELCGVSGVPVSKGADSPLRGPTPSAENIHGAAGLGYAELTPGTATLTGYDAAAAWVRAAHHHPGRLVGLVTGPLTNLALALRAEPALPTLLRRLVIMGGSFDPADRTAPTAEFNIRTDPEAAAEVFAAVGTPELQRLPIVCGFELTERIALTPAILERLAAAGSAHAGMNGLQPRGTRSTAANPVIRLLEDAMRFYFEAHYDRYGHYLAYLHDPLAAAVALDPELVRTRPAAVHVELTHPRGRTAPDWQGSEPNAQVGVDVDPAAFFDRFVQRIGAFARNRPQPSSGHGEVVSPRRKGVAIASVAKPGAGGTLPQAGGTATRLRWPGRHGKEFGVLGLPETVHACLFDLDGVLTDTASVHTKAWTAMFDTYLSKRADRTGEPFVAFDPVNDYRRFVDGRKREDGVRSFLASRGITLPEGGGDDPPDAETVHGLGNRKNEAFHKTLRADGVQVFDGSRRYLEAAAAAGLTMAVVSASANAGEILAVTGLEKFVAQRVDGVTLRTEHIAGKPAPDSFLRAAQLLSVAPAAAAVFEDALSGVAAGRAGDFGFVVGVDRVGQTEDLYGAGADIVVTDLAELLVGGKHAF